MVNLLYAPLPLQVSALARPVLQLLSCVSSFIRELPRRCVLEQPAPHVAALVTEWKDIFAPDINRNLFEMLVIVLSENGSDPNRYIYNFLN